MQSKAQYVCMSAVLIVISRYNLKMNFELYIQTFRTLTFFIWIFTCVQQSAMITFLSLIILVILTAPTLVLLITVINSLTFFGLRAKIYATGCSSLSYSKFKFAFFVLIVNKEIASLRQVTECLAFFFGFDP